ncbi:MAG TPA: group 1 truncated hemoglobin [Steroidobacteraceae bacterium]|jgi:hemoglobin|nr:group 1 truncated hemoglobin [Steroidobacteraceae bacterium]
MSMKPIQHAAFAARVLACTLLASLATGVAHAEGATLYDQIGGEAKMHAVAEEFTRTILADDRINFTFANTDLKKFTQLIFEQFCNLAGGPCKYTGRDMKTSHEKLNIDNAMFNALTEDLYIAFERVHVPYRLQNKLIVLLAPMQKDIVKR